MGKRKGWVLLKSRSVYSGEMCLLHEENKKAKDAHSRIPRGGSSTVVTFCKSCGSSNMRNWAESSIADYGMVVSCRQ